MCKTKEVEPRAETFNSVVLCSTKKAMKMKAKSGQTPGEGWRCCHARNPTATAVSVVALT